VEFVHSSRFSGSLARCKRATFVIGGLAVRVVVGPAALRPEVVLRQIEMFHANRTCRRWEQTDDVFQNSMVRLHRAREVESGATVRLFQLGGGAGCDGTCSIWRSTTSGRRAAGPTTTRTANPPMTKVAALQRAREPEKPGGVDRIPRPGEKSCRKTKLEVVNTLYYGGLTQEEAARVLGISFRTLKRRWHSARLKLYEALKRDGQE